MSARSHNIPIESFADRINRVRNRLFALARMKPSKPFDNALGLDDFPKNEEIHRLLTTMFYASLEFDEMRASRFAVNWQHPAIGRSFIAKFDEPLELSSSSLIAKLAHATDRESAISLGLVGEGAICSAPIK